MSRSKMSPAHLARIETVDALYRELQPNPAISKFAFGAITRTGGGGQPRVRLAYESGCMKLTVRGRNAVQYLRIFFHDKKAAETAVHAAAKRLGLTIKEFG